MVPDGQKSWPVCYIYTPDEPGDDDDNDDVDEQATLARGTLNFS